jgi:hypothetical protein
LIDQLVFPGGCATGLLLTDIAAPPIRATHGGCHFHSMRITHWVHQENGYQGYDLVKEIFGEMNYRNRYRNRYRNGMGNCAWTIELLLSSHQ